MHHPTDRIAHTMTFAGTQNSSMVYHEGSIQWPIAPWANILATELYLAPLYQINFWKTIMFLNFILNNNIYLTMYSSNFINGISDAWSGARCSYVVRVFAHSVMGRRIDPSWGWIHWAISCSSQCSTTGVTKAMVCAILSVGWCI